jgi:2,5-diamino-6-(ribosylamino)-4(3H)-pyrimidinone 5'-phosphate reductase
MNRPHIIVNVAMTADGKIDSIARKGATISSDADKRRVDELRASVDAILVGGRTLLDEDPKLTVKSADLRAARVRQVKPENPAKVGMATVIPSVTADILLAGDGAKPSKIGAAQKLLHNFLNAGQAQRIIYTTKRTPPETVTWLQKAGANVFILGEKRVDFPAALDSLYRLGIRKLLIEGGGTTIAELFRLGYVDEITVYIAPKIFGGESAPSLADGPGFRPEQAPGLQLVSAEAFDEEGGVLLHYTVQHNK